MTTTPEQPVLDLDAACAPVSPRADSGGVRGPVEAAEALRSPEDAPSVGRIEDRRRIYEAGGAARLLRDLVRAGLDPDALGSAATLVAALDREARLRR